MTDKYILDENKNPVPCEDLIEWAEAYEVMDRKVAEDTVGEARASTVFLGMDHQWGEGPPVLFETMIFGGEHDQYQDRYQTWDQAEKGHRRVVACLKLGANPEGDD